MMDPFVWLWRLNRIHRRRTCWLSGLRSRVKKVRPRGQLRADALDRGSPFFSGESNYWQAGMPAPLAEKLTLPHLGDTLNQWE
jgi:hypothetical protein